MSNNAASVKVADPTVIEKTGKNLKGIYALCMGVAVLGAMVAIGGGGGTLGLLMLLGGGVGVLVTRMRMWWNHG